MLALLFGAVEFGRYVLITQKVEKSGYTLGNVLTQYTGSRHRPAEYLRRGIQPVRDRDGALRQ
ncbi:MAG: hypothetical protein WDN72_03265 [Alphaproteobacteria bacterium]